jgi:hypothetical protein
VKEDVVIFPRSLSIIKRSKEQSRRVGSHWPVQLKKPADSSVRGINPSDPSKQKNRNLFRGACMLLTRNVNSVEYGYAVDSTKIIILTASEISILNQTYSIMSLQEQSMNPMRKARPMMKKN